MKAQKNFTMSECFLLILLISLFSQTLKSWEPKPQIAKKFMNFELFDKARGINLRRKIEDYADEHGIIGWITLNKEENILGEAYGAERAIYKMESWLTDKKNPVFQGKIKGC